MALNATVHNSGPVPYVLGGFDGSDVLIGLDEDENLDIRIFNAPSLTSGELVQQVLLSIAYEIIDNCGEDSEMRVLKNTYEEAEAN